MNQKKSMDNRLSVLHIDDDKVIRDMIARIIEQCGHQCHSLPTNRDFSPASAAQGRFDVILHDGQIPDGTHGKKWLREFGALDPKTPRVLISGEVSDKDIPELLKEGIIALGKPFELAQFNNLLLRFHIEKTRRLGMSTRGEMRGGVFTPMPNGISPHGHSVAA